MELEKPTGTKPIAEPAAKQAAPEQKQKQEAEETGTLSDEDRQEINNAPQIPTPLRITIVKLAIKDVYSLLFVDEYDKVRARVGVVPKEVIKEFIKNATEMMEE